MIADAGAVGVAKRWVQQGRTAVVVGGALQDAAAVLAQRLRGAEVEGLDEPSAAACVAVLERLIELRCFREALTVGKAAVARYTHVLRVHRLLVQALIDSGDLDGASRALDEACVSFPDARGAEAAEIEGMRGRLAKQRYVVQRSRYNAGGEVELQAALHAYVRRFTSCSRRPYWHGINAVALSEAAARLQIETGIDFDAKAAANEIVIACRDEFAQNPDNLWNLATAAEASLALRQWEESELWMYRYATHPEVTPFMIASTARQMREIWGLRSSPHKGGRCLLVLEQQLARQGLYELRAGDAQSSGAQSASHLERVFGKERFMGYDRFHQALQACASVARIEDSGSGRGVGTGFLVMGRVLSDRLPDRPVLVTNAHVISRTGTADALQPGQARVRFEVAARNSPGYVPHAIDQVLWSSPPALMGDLSCPDAFMDVTICTLHGLPDTVATLKLAQQPPRVSDKSKAYVIGHPDGDGLQFSLADSQLLDMCDGPKLVHYRTPTVGGSSGSPVFDADWAVYAIHHAGQVNAPRLHGEGNHDANEGILIDAIRRAILA